MFLMVFGCSSGAWLEISSRNQAAPSYIILQNNIRRLLSHKIASVFVTPPPEAILKDFVLPKWPLDGNSEK